CESCATTRRSPSLRKRFGCSWPILRTNWPRSSRSAASRRKPREPRLRQHEPGRPIPQLPQGEGLAPGPSRDAERRWRRILDQRLGQDEQDGAEVLFAVGEAEGRQREQQRREARDGSRRRPERRHSLLAALLGETVNEQAI